ncbi:MAG TPA: Uma2 family endonuclease [Thermoanaerobaculia bacterium]|jgi:Uma2 family endonuclease
MAEPAWKTPPEDSDEPDFGLPDDDREEGVYLQRVVERPDGTRELLDIPLTPEDFLNPQYGDKWVQGRPHGRTCLYFSDVLERHLRFDESLLVLYDVRLLSGPGRDGPAPDVMVVRGARDPDPDLSSFDVAKQGTVPCLIVEVLSPTSKRIRNTDVKDKKGLYQRLGIPEYLMVDLPRRSTEYRFVLRGYRLGPYGRYRKIPPDSEGRLLSETTEVLFGVSADGQRVELFDARTGERLLNSREEEEGRKAERAARKAAEARAAREAKTRKVVEERAAKEVAARKAAEEELKRLRAEIERLKASGR